MKLFNMDGFNDIASDKFIKDEINDKIMMTIKMIEKEKRVTLTDERELIPTLIDKCKGYTQAQVSYLCSTWRNDIYEHWMT